MPQTINTNGRSPSPTSLARLDASASQSPNTMDAGARSNTATETVQSQQHRTTSDATLNATLRRRRTTSIIGDRIVIAGQADARFTRDGGVDSTPTAAGPQSTARRASTPEQDVSENRLSSASTLSVSDIERELDDRPAAPNEGRSSPVPDDDRLPPDLMAKLERSAEQVAAMSRGSQQAATTDHQPAAHTSRLAVPETRAQKRLSDIAERSDEDGSVHSG